MAARFRWIMISYSVPTKGISSVWLRKPPMAHKRFTFFGHAPLFWDGATNNRQTPGVRKIGRPGDSFDFCEKDDGRWHAADVWMTFSNHRNRWDPSWSGHVFQDPTVFFGTIPFFSEAMGCCRVTGKCFQGSRMIWLIFQSKVNGKHTRFGTCENHGVQLSLDNWGQRIGEYLWVIVHWRTLYIHTYIHVCVYIYIYMYIYIYIYI